MKIKVCGMTDVNNVKQLVRLQPDYMGFIFHRQSPRFVQDDAAISIVPQSIKKTAVVVDLPVKKVTEIIDQHGFDAVQLHGRETPEFCSQFKGKMQVLKAFGVDDAFDFSQLDAYASHVDYFLFDTKTPIHGGSGVAFNWDVLQNYKLNIPFFLSGGISLDNLEKIKQIKHPQFYGVDLNSRFEIQPGLKDIIKLEQAFKILR